MDTIYDYIRWMGELSFEAYPFQELDALVLSMLSYYDFSPLLSERGSESFPLRDAQILLDENRVRVLITGGDKHFPALLQAAVSSRRFGELEICHYRDVLRQDPPLQFAAMTFRAPDFSFLAFRGTDNTLVGWKEDFMIGFTVTEAQEMASAYAEEVIQEPGRYYIGGHSKGGNLALYAASLLSEEKWQQVERLFLLDGPGLCPEVMALDCLEKIDRKTTRIVPTFSVIGQLFAPALSDHRIVRSTASGIMQHALYTWGVDHGKLALADAPSPRSRWLNETLASWIGGISQEDRVIFINELFDALTADGAVTVDDLERKGSGSFEASFFRLLSASAVTKKTIYDLPKRAIFGENYEDITQKGLAGWLRDKYREWVENQDNRAEEEDAAGKS